MAGTYSNILLHFIFSTKQRAAMIKPAIQPRLHDYIGGIIRGEQGVLYAIGGMPDHLHLLIRWRPSGSISDLIRDLKSQSSLWVHQTFPAFHEFEWQGGYGVFSVSRSQVDAVKTYIETQEQHHRGRTFQEEFLDFLHAHEIEYDPRYIWD